MQESLKEFYWEYKNEVKTYKGYVLTGIDGSDFEVPNTKSSREKYNGKQQTQCARVTVSTCYDLLNHYTLDTIVEHYDYSETKMAKKTLVERNLRLVVYIAKKFENTWVGLEGLISIGTIGLMKAINTFNTDKKIKLATYASRCIENEILMHLRRSNRIKSEISIDEPLNQDGDGNELLLLDILGTDPDVTSRRMEDEVDRKLLKASMEKLNNREKNIMELRFGFVSGNEKI